METVLFLPDQHFPHADWNALSVAHAVGQDAAPDLVILGGDTLDFSRASRFSDSELLALYEHDLQDELDETENYLRQVALDFPQAAKRYIKANHEWRFDKFIARHAPKLQVLRALRFDRLLPFAELGYTVETARIYLARGRFVVKHGSRYGIYAARHELADEGRSGLSGHNHRTAQHVHVSPRQPPLSWWGVGCLCELEPKYKEIDAKAANWNHGFAIVYIDGQDYAVDNIIIDRGVAYWRGTRYAATS